MPARCAWPLCKRMIGTTVALGTPETRTHTGCLHELRSYGLGEEDSRITMVEGLLGESLPTPPPRKLATKRKHTEATGDSAGKQSKEDHLAKKMDVLIKALLMLQAPPSGILQTDYRFTFNLGKTRETKLCDPPPPSRLYTWLSP